MRIFDQHNAIGRFCDFGQERIGQRGLAGRGTARHENVLACSNSVPETFSLSGSQDAGGDIVVEGEDADSRLANGEGWSGDHGGQQHLETLACLGQLRRDAGTCQMNLRADVMGNQPHRS